MYCHQGYSFLMKANDSRCGSVFGQQIARESILGPLCLCCAPNMICTCLLLCCLQSWAWPALSGGLCQRRNLCGAVKCCIRAQNSSSVNKILCQNKALFFCFKNEFSRIASAAKVMGTKHLCLVFPPLLYSLTLQELYILRLWLEMFVYAHRKKWLHS